MGNENRGNSGNGIKENAREGKEDNEKAAKGREEE